MNTAHMIVDGFFKWIRFRSPLFWSQMAHINGHRYTSVESSSHVVLKKWLQNLAEIFRSNILYSIWCEMNKVVERLHRRHKTESLWILWHTNTLSDWINRLCRLQQQQVLCILMRWGTTPITCSNALHWETMRARLFTNTAGNLKQWLIAIIYKGSPRFWIFESIWYLRRCRSKSAKGRN